MVTVKKTLENHLFSFIKKNRLESMQDKFIEALTKCEYEVRDAVERLIEDETMNACKELENDIKHYQEEIHELEYEIKQLKIRDEFFIPKTIEDEFKIQWVKDNWDRIPSL